HAAVISYEFWKRRFGLDPGVVGRKVTINDMPLVIAGVTPPGFFGFDVGARADLWWPIRVSNDPTLRRKTSSWIRVMGRLRRGASAAQAQAEMDVIFRQQLDEFVAPAPPNVTPEQRRQFFERSIRLEPGGAGYTWLWRRFRQPLLVMMI